jgi:hypothetical protein
MGYWLFYSQPRYVDTLTTSACRDTIYYQSDKGQIK